MTYPPSKPLHLQTLRGLFLLDDAIAVLIEEKDMLLQRRVVLRILAATAPADLESWEFTHSRTRRPYFFLASPPKMCRSRLQFSWVMRSFRRRLSRWVVEEMT